MGKNFRCNVGLGIFWSLSNCRNEEVTRKSEINVDLHSYGGIAIAEIVRKPLAINALHTTQHIAREVIMNYLPYLISHVLLFLSEREGDEPEPLVRRLLQEVVRHTVLPVSSRQNPDWQGRSGRTARAHSGKSPQVSPRQDPDWQR